MRTSVHCIMEIKKVTILSVKKNEITICLKKKYRPRLQISFVVIAVMMLCFVFGGTDVRTIGLTMSRIYNPVSSLYNDNSDVVFTNGTLSSENLIFYVPLIANYEIINGDTVVFTVTNSIMVKAPEAGVIKDIGVTNNGIKYIKIKHSETVWSLIENVDIVGVKENEIVSRGKDIATAKENSKVYFQIYENDGRIKNINVQSTKIVW